MSFRFSAVTVLMVLFACTAAYLAVQRYLPYVSPDNVRAEFTAEFNNAGTYQSTPSAATRKLAARWVHTIDEMT